ncbi:MAG TPA: beta-ketoacyl-ACP synthase [Povalibacter sp.]|uniref:beta-ketoacyl-ACP synthase n=1 Tax=Povalibacter sp. TaxID=1962978 RepID=UPI002CFB9671|nr:beta-ketoacyl-ACP synthase [Povalibacter sp.]HMN44789.1 beta-ketoacyl-ACP synthase [Povalibacter sp.]
MKPLPISAYTVSSALGAGHAAHARALQAGTSGLRKLTFDTNTLDCWLGEVRDFDVALTGSLAHWDCRNHRLAEFALNQDGFLDAVAACVRRHGAARIGVFIGTSTSGVHHTELAYRARDPQSNALPDWFVHRPTQNIFSVADFVAQRLGLGGPSFAISTACSSSAKVFAAARRAIAAGACDAAVVGGVDSLCLTTLYGFNSLQLVSPDICRPADSARNGISIGEAGGFALLDPHADGGLRLLGYGETSDAYHMSSPDPEGSGAAASMRAALASANLEPAQIDYINLHGTGTVANDQAESRAVCSVFGTATPCSSTKGWTGHTLGAAGIVESVISLLTIENDLLPRSLNTRSKDPAIEANILLANRSTPVLRVLSNSFGFGGSNCSLLFGKAA